MDTLTVFISSAIGEFASERKALKAALGRWQFVRAWVSEEARVRAKAVLEATMKERQLSLLLPSLSDGEANICNTAYEIIEAVKRRLNLPKDYVIEGRSQKDEGGNRISPNS